MERGFDDVCDCAVRMLGDCENGKSPYETFSFYYGEELVQKLGGQMVATGDINLTPGLLKK